MTDEVLRTENLARAFGGLQAVAGVSLSLYAGKVTALVGPNGAGKTCLLNCVGGFYTATSGRIARVKTPLVVSQKSLDAVVSVVATRNTLSRSSIAN